MLFGEINLHQRLQSLLRRHGGSDAGGQCIRLRTRAVSGLGQHGFAGIKMGIKSTMRQAGLFHDVGNTGSVVPTAPDGARRSIHDALVRGFFGGGTDIG